MIFDITSDNLVEKDILAAVTLYDAEHLPQSWESTYYGMGATGAYAPADTAGIGNAGPNTLADWGTTIRDPNAYTADYVVKNDDVRLWLGGFSQCEYGS